MFVDADEMRYHVRLSPTLSPPSMILRGSPPSGQAQLSISHESLLLLTYGFGFKGLDFKHGHDM